MYKLQRLESPCPPIKIIIAFCGLSDAARPTPKQHNGIQQVNGFSRSQYQTSDVIWAIYLDVVLPLYTKAVFYLEL